MEFSGSHRELTFEPGDHGGGDTPVPIPNTAVKTARADGTWRESSWESRSSPGFFAKTETPADFGGRLSRTLHSPHGSESTVNERKPRRPSDGIERAPAGKSGGRTRSTGAP